MSSRSASWSPALLDDLVLSRGVVDRAAGRRQDEAWLAHARRLPDARVMSIHRGQCAVIATTGGAGADDVHLLWMPGPDVDPDQELTFLGVDSGHRPYFARHLDDAQEAERGADAGVRWVTLRDVGHRLDDLNAGLAVAAVALDNWRHATRWCASCGEPLRVSASGWSQRCVAEAIEHFPRTEPAVIVLIRDPHDRALLGRQGIWQPTWFSTFAGFVEAGESAEAALRREVLEETGIVIDAGPQAIAYLGSQPWPFPASLMLGYHARTSNPEVSVDETEIAEAHWFTREELLRACESGRIHLPPAVSISRKLIERWYGSPLPGHWLR